MWKDIEGYKGFYQINEEGVVRSLPRLEYVESTRTGGHYRKRMGRIIAQSKNNAGYMQVHLHIDGGTKAFSVHRLVAISFIPNPYDKPEVNHIDEDKTNNKVSNLEWSTRVDNELHSSYRMRGSSNGYSLLSEEQVLEITKMLSDNISQVNIAKHFNISNHTVHKIKVGKNWGWLTGLN